MSESLELEIKSLLDESGQPSTVAEKIVAMVENSGEGIQAREVDTIARFLLQTGLYIDLINFVLRHFRKKSFPVPWPHFLEAIARTQKEISQTMANALLEGIEVTNGLDAACVSTLLDDQTETLKKHRMEAGARAAMNFQSEKKKLLDQLPMLRTQQLYEREKEVLQKLHRMFPGDADVSREMQSHQHRNALDVLSKHGHIRHSYEFKDNEDLLKKPLEIFTDATQRVAKKNKDLSIDLAVAAAMIGDFALGLELLEKAPTRTVETQWLRFELLLGARRFVELLNELAPMEQFGAGDPETFFATAYLRAQALWGLGQRHQAIEILESLLASRPQYRSANALLNLWRSP